MQLPPALRARLAGGPGAAEPLPVERDLAARAAPFRFAARRVRLPREHELFEDGDVQRHLYLQDVLTQVAEAPERPRVPEFTCQVAGCCQVFDALEDYEHHYHTLHRNVCSFCRRAFPSGHLLDAHILEWHDSLFQILSERQDMYQCLVEGCAHKFRTSEDRRDHMPSLAGARRRGAVGWGCHGSELRTRDTLCGTRGWPAGLQPEDTFYHLFWSGCISRV
ncbi:zinc finger protein 511 isoform X2 [Cynocephalus volans]|uniref:zinc finger protein 511 isoform X2 n=1 Tax=Cynocephalus volans TaxID=110931 RepID=UPI002FC8A281